MGNSASRDARKASAAEKQRKALELRKAGANYDQIAEQLGYANRAGVWKAVKSAIKEIIREPAQEVLSLELERLDTMLLGCWAKAKSGDLQAIDRALRIMERRAKFLGLDAPDATVQLTADVNAKDVRQELLDRLARLTEAAAASEAPDEPQ